MPQSFATVMIVAVLHGRKHFLLGADFRWSCRPIASPSPRRARSAATTSPPASMPPRRRPASSSASRRCSASCRGAWLRVCPERRSCAKPNGSCWRGSPAAGRSYRGGAGWRGGKGPDSELAQSGEFDVPRDRPTPGTQRMRRHRPPHSRARAACCTIFLQSSSLRRFLSELHAALKMAMYRSRRPPTWRPQVPSAGCRNSGSRSAFGCGLILEAIMVLKARNTEDSNSKKVGREQLGYSPLIKVINCLSLIWLLAAAATSGWPSDAFAQQPEPHSQYAVKFVCGQPPPQAASLIVIPGQYLTSINIHNPSTEPVEYRWKTAQALDMADGRISPWVYGTTGPDGAQTFVCRRYVQGMSGNPPFDGFFVIESRLPLDVTAVYTAAPAGQGVSSIHVDKIAARPVDNKCQRNAPIDLSIYKFWTIATGDALEVPPNATIIGAWDSTRRWMAYAADGVSPATGGPDFIYQLDFCSCSSQGGTLTGDVKSDDGASGNVTNPIGTLTMSSIFAYTQGNFGPGIPTQFTPTTLVGGGNGRIQVTVNDAPGSYTGVSFSGSLILSYGHSGRCR